MSAIRDAEVVRYVVVVHGIGEQRENETVLPVIHRFAEARREGGAPSSAAKQVNPLTLGTLSSYREWGRWNEFDGIPCDPTDRSCKLPFIGRRLDHPAGKNLRFVDLHWADVMKGQFDEIGVGLGPWTSSLLDRLQTHGAPPWILELVRNMRAGLIPLQRLLGLRLPGLSDKIFNRFIGDAQLYGEFNPTRGKGVRKFHDILAGIHAAHQSGKFKGSPRYSVIAHSLGSVLAFDALLYAHAARQGSAADPDWDPILMPGYDDGRDGAPSSTSSGGHAAALPALDWIENVDSLVTLGSPIDKYLILWWQNYEHLCRTDWMAPKYRTGRETRIEHFNYCDEQDPVGHELDVAYTAPAVNAVFEKKEEFVFTRYAAPGVAHVKYWTDSELFARILDLAVDRKPAAEARPLTRFRRQTYSGVLFWSYFALPLSGWTLATLSMIWAMNPNVAWSTRLPVGLLSLFGVLLPTCWIMTLMVQWRQLMRTKRTHGAAVLPAKERRRRRDATWIVRFLIAVAPFVFAYGLVASIYAAAGAAAKAPALLLRPAAAWIAEILPWLKTLHIGTWYPKALQQLEPPSFFAALIVALLFALLLALVNLIVFLRMKWKWSEKRMSMRLNFVDYLNTGRPAPAGSQGEPGEASAPPAIPDR